MRGNPRLHSRSVWQPLTRSPQELTFWWDNFWKELGGFGHLLKDIVPYWRLKLVLEALMKPLSCAGTGLLCGQDSVFVSVMGLSPMGKPCLNRGYQNG